jgi:hypothetical protein
MFQVLDDSIGDYVALKAIGKITSRDYDTLIPYLKKAIKKEGPLKILCDMTNFDGMEIKAAWRDFRFGMHHIRDFHRCALVGASKWVEWCVKITVPFFKLEVRLFQTGQEKEARNWLAD